MNVNQYTRIPRRVGRRRALQPIGADGQYLPVPAPPPPPPSPPPPPPAQGPPQAPAQIPDRSRATRRALRDANRAQAQETARVPVVDIIGENENEVYPTNRVQKRKLEDAERAGKWFSLFFRSLSFAF
ncbi:hypothetical protein BSKO_08357 [Bryopsis sp. KO-2023]|nr:hypothetical protein BSKO_08357 [Bryopsis sp. KO-2023]